MQESSAADSMIETILAERIDLTAIKTLSRRELDRLPKTAVIDACHNIAGDLVVKLNAYMAGMLDERIQVNVSWPIDWWQAFKERWFPAWLRRRFPVIRDGVYVDKKIYKAICPHVHADPETMHLKWLRENSQ